MSSPTFGDWPPEIHLEKKQISKQKKALGADLSPLEVDYTENSAVFVGTSASRYHTWLNECECESFQRDRAPCKHIYRLAMELELFPGIEQAAHTDPTTLAQKRDRMDAPQLPAEQVLELISGLTKEEHYEFASLCYSIGKGNKNGPLPVPIPLARELEALGLVTIPAEPRARAKNVRCLLADCIAQKGRAIYNAIYQKYPKPDPVIVFFPPDWQG